MSGETRVIAFGSGEQEPKREELPLTEELEVAGPEAEAEINTAAEVEWEDSPVKRPRDWLLPALAAVAVIAWSAFFIWTRQAEFTAAPQSATWSELISDWAVPVLLIGTVWLLLMRNSRREAVRFGNTARMLSDEAARLEARLSTVNRELSLAREFIGAQSRDLEALGRRATERLSKNADELDGLVKDNSARLEAIGNVSEAALDNMEKLRGQLPVIASSAKDITNNIASAGRTAHSQLSEMIKGFERLNEFGQVSEQQVQTLRGAVDEAIAEFARQCEQLDEIASNRFNALAERGEEFRTQLATQETDALAALRARGEALAEELVQARQQFDQQEAESLTSLRARLTALRDESTAVARAMREGEDRAIENWRTSIEQMKEEVTLAAAALEQADMAAVDAAKARLTTLSEEALAMEERIAERNRSFDEEVERRRSDAEASDGQIIARLSERLAAFDAEIEQRRTAHEQQSAAIAAHSEAIAQRLDACERRLSEIAGLSDSTEASIAAGMNSLGEKLAAARSELEIAGSEISELTDASASLLSLIENSASLSRDDLQQALQMCVERISVGESQVESLIESVREADKHGENLTHSVTAAEENLTLIATEISDRQEALERHGAAYQTKLDELRSVLEAIEQQSDRLAEKAQGELSEAIKRLGESANEAASAISEKGAGAISQFAEKLGEESAAAVEKAIQESITQTAGKLDEATSQATSVSREATVQLRDQLAKVNELVGNLERRVAYTRERAEEQVDNDFSRRVALITESLNSNAIDIERAIATDVSDTAWASYLRGDRGIFTRRAVNLIESGEARAIAQVFENDSDFREHVSRYIHDFEAILRQVLSTRDGHALGVTLLSSDMGKLYVALAQAIERLRD